MKALALTFMFFVTFQANAKPAPLYRCGSAGAASSATVIIYPLVKVAGGWPNPEAAREFYPVEIVDASGKVIRQFDGVGDVTPATAQLTLLQGGDMAMGSLAIGFAYEHNQFRGELRLSDTAFPKKANLVCISR